MHLCGHQHRRVDLEDETLQADKLQMAGEKDQETPAVAVRRPWVKLLQSLGKRLPLEQEILHTGSFRNRILHIEKLTWTQP